MILSRAALCALAWLCSGCLHHTIATGQGYRIDDKGGAPMLVPTEVQATDAGNFQTVMLTLPRVSSPQKTHERDNCAIEGETFSMHSVQGSDRASWVVRSPSVSGWDELSGAIDMEGQWNLFVRDLARIVDRGCSPPGVTSESIRTAIAKRIPLPTNLVPTFMYSDQGERFVNLAPGMQIGIQKVLPTEASLHSGSGKALRILNVIYDVVSRPGDGIRLRLNRGSENVHAASLRAEDRPFLTLDQRFAKTLVLRLFLQGFSQGESESDAILIGTSDATQLDVLTDLIRQKDPVACMSFPRAACIDLPHGSASLFAMIWINGRRTASPFGTSLASLLFLLPPSKLVGALKSVQVMREMSSGRYGGIQFTRTEEGVRQVLLLPGDKIVWDD
jgi:hypothetical protein